MISLFHIIYKNFLVSDRQVMHCYQMISPSSYAPDMATLRLCDESELRRGDVIGSGAFGTVFKVRASTDIKLLQVLRLIPRLHNEAGSTSWLYERTTSVRRAAS